MKRLNPIYILALIATLLIISFTSLSQKKDEYKSLNKNLNSLSIKAESFNEYKSSWFNKRKVIKKLDSIVKSSSFRKEKILRVENKNIIRVKIQSENPRVLNKFLNRVLNEKFIFKKLDIQKDSISFEIGVK